MLGAILPFSISVLFVTKGIFLNKPREKYMARPVLSTILGFYYLLGVVDHSRCLDCDICM